jgi:hypothetical protein
LPDAHRKNSRPRIGAALGGFFLLQSDPWFRVIDGEKNF